MLFFMGKIWELFFKIQVKKYLVWPSLFYKDKLYFYYKNILHWILPSHHTVYRFPSDTLDKVAQDPS